MLPHNLSPKERREAIKQLSIRVSWGEDGALGLWYLIETEEAARAAIDFDENESEYVVDTEALKGVEINECDFVQTLSMEFDMTIEKLRVEKEALEKFGVVFSQLAGGE